MVEYRVVDHDDERFPDWVCIEVVEDGVVTSRSWAPPDVPVEVRLNPDYPEAIDRRASARERTPKIRRREPTAEERDRLDSF